MGRNRKTKKKRPHFSNSLDVTKRLQQGVQLHQKGDFGGAQRIYASILSAHTDQIDALYLSGVALMQSGHEEKALPFLEKAVQIDPGKEDYIKALITALNNSGLARQDEGNLDQALAYYNRALEINPDFTLALNNKGMILRTKNDLDQAAGCLSRALLLDPAFYEAWVNLGHVYKDQCNLEQALACYEKAASLNPSSFQVFNNIGSAFYELKDYETAKQFFVKAVELCPSFDEAYYNLGCVYFAMNQTEEALHAYLTCLKINPSYARAYSNAGNVYYALKRYDEAESFYLKACELEPGFAEAYNNAGNLYQSRNDFTRSLAYLNKAVELAPHVAEFHFNLGLLYKKYKDYENAEKCLLKAIESSPSYADAHFYLGEIHKERQRFDDAVSCFQKTLELNADYPYAIDQLCSVYQRVCEWDKADGLINQLRASLENGEEIHELPHNSLSRYEEPALCYKVAKFWSDNVVAPTVGSTMSFSFGEDRKHKSVIRVGYLSNSFSNHPGGHLIAGLFKYHDRSKVQINLYSYGPGDGSYYRKKAEHDCDRFIDIRMIDDCEAAKRIYEDRIDILVDLRGYTQGNRAEICALRPAPVQVVYLGFAGTSGASFYDYIIADKTIAPYEHRPYFRENIVYMPGSYQVTNNEQTISDEHFTREGEGLPNEGFVFCSFNTPYKIEPVMFGCWMEILKEVSGSVLWLLNESETMKKNLINEAEKRGISCDRLVFAKKMEKQRHLKRTGLADLCLDTRVYTGHTTTSDCLWAGVPVISMIGGHFASRVSASILRAGGLPELVVSDLESYMSLAIDLASHQSKLKKLKQKVLENRTKTPLFDTKQFAADLEKAYLKMWSRYTAGFLPDKIELN